MKVFTFHLLQKRHVTLDGEKTEFGDLPLNNIVNMLVRRESWNCHDNTL